MQLGLICSGGGSVLAASHDLLSQSGFHLDWAVVTDRACGAETVCATRGIPFKRIEEANNVRFSCAAADWLLGDRGCSATGLLFSRLVSADLFERSPCINVHPSLLPAFPGLGALDAAWRAGVRLMGATAHYVNHSIDGGPIIAQVAGPAPMEKESFQRLSFAQKTYLLLVIAELVEYGRLGDDMRVVLDCDQPGGELPGWASPPILNAKLAAALASFCRSEDIEWPTP